MTAIILFLFLGFIIFMFAAMWRVYEKAGEPGWAAIVPIYNLIVWMRIIRKPGWWVLLLFLPIVSIVMAVWSTNLLAKAFGKTEGWTLGLIFLPFIFYPMLAWGDAEYQYSEPALQSPPDILDAGIR
ncbi:MAG TPA: DUF5684 domain-containing protein [Saprospiraceae bacterium]|nr:DUF5684 domain-containing protein [Saprospiraceae bacterium]HND89438.1 DUF5684 domain-containing protein [Saprospiraceae bacterium]